MRVADYVAPQSLDEAIALLGQDASARPLAGGNQLLVEPSRSHLAGTRLVDLGRIPGLIGIQHHGGGVQIGATTSLAAIADDATLAQRYPALVEAIHSIGDAQVRNRATLGGNLAERDPGNDLPAVLIALGGQIQIKGPTGERTLSTDELIAGSLRQGELITAVMLAAPAARTGSAYEKFKHPATLYAICGVAASVTLGADGSVASSAIAVTGATESPTRLDSVATALQGKQPDAASLAEAANRIDGQLRFRGDHFASAEYRRHLTGVLTERALSRAVERARQSV